LGGSSTIGTFAVSPDSQWAIAATTTDGNLLWSYLLPRGNYASVGTHEGSVVIFALRYIPSSGDLVPRPILRVDPNNGTIVRYPSDGTLSEISTDNETSTLCYAGDSTLFRIVAGLGEIWGLDNALRQNVTGISSPTLAKKFPLKALIAPDTIAVVDAIGMSMALISLRSASVRESSILRRGRRKSCCSRPRD
jgi:hypothetical protein